MNKNDATLWIRPWVRRRRALMFAWVAVLAWFWWRYPLRDSNKSRKAQYLSDQRTGRRERTVISLTTNSHRMINPMFREVIVALCNQSHSPDAVYINVPLASRSDPLHKPKGQSIRIPAWLLKMNSSTQSPVYVHVMNIDYGPGTKLLGALKVETDPNTRILYLDDDNVYANNVLEVLLESARLHPEAALGFQGIIPRADGYPCIYWSAPNLVQVAVLEGCAGVLVRRGSFGEDVFSVFAGASSSCRLGDDLYLSAYLSARGVQRRVVDRPDAHRYRRPGVRGWHDGSTYGDVVVKGFEDMHSLHRMHKGGLGNIQHYANCIRSDTTLIPRLLDEMWLNSWTSPISFLRQHVEDEVMLTCPDPQMPWTWFTDRGDLVVVS